MTRTGRTLLILLAVTAFALLFFASAMPARSAPPDTVRVWVEYRPGQERAVEQALRSNGAQFHYSFPQLSSYVVTLPRAALAGIQNNPNVVGMEDDPERYLLGDQSVDLFSTALAGLETVALPGQVVPYGIDAVQARDVWDANRDGVIDSGAPTGAGRTVCIIDTGFYRDHEDFQGITVSGYSQQATEWYIDGNGHGSHVAGTIAGVNNGVGVVGVTPGTVSLYIVKFFNDDGVATLASDLVDAAYRCQAGGANVISMSLGGSRSNVRERRAFDDLYAQGILNVAAAGNDGTTAYSYPASYNSVISVAAVDSTNTVAGFSQQNDQVELAAPGVGVLSTVPYIDVNSLTVDGVTYSANHIEFSGRGTASGALVNGGLCDSVGAWSGKVVLCERGVISFYDKVMNVQNGGGVAAVIYNNAPGNFLGTLGDGNSSSIIGISLSQEDGQYLVANKLGATGTVSSSYTWPASGYEYYDGTSMATPHVSAVAALVWSANPSWTNVQIRDALAQTALDLGAAGRDNATGYGLVQAKAALDFLGGGTPPPPPPTGALHVTVTTDKSTYSDRQTVYITVHVTDDGGAAVGGAAVNVTITAANGTTWIGSSTTNAAGDATFSYKINVRKGGRGTYTVTATASKDGYTSGSGSTTFTVQ